MMTWLTECPSYCTEREGMLLVLISSASTVNCFVQQRQYHFNTHFMSTGDETPNMKM